MEKTVSEAIAYRRSCRVYKDEPIDTNKVKQGIENAVLAPTSSNLQLWEFYHVVDKELIKKLDYECFKQNAAKTAQQLVVVVARKDIWRKRSKANIDFLNNAFDKPDLEDRHVKRKKMAMNYYQKVMPITYFDFLGIFGMLKYLVFQLIGLFRPFYRQASFIDMRIVAHNSAGLAAQNFMISMAAIGYDTCPMEGTDTRRIKRLLDLPPGAEINMVIGCGIRKPTGVYGDRFRIPFQDVYKEW